MCFVVFAIVTFVVGLIAVITGKVALSRSLTVYGTMARIIGLILMAAGPVGFGAAMVVAIAMGVATDPSKAKGAEVPVTITQVGVFAGFIILAVILAALSPKGKKANPPRYEHDDRGDDDYAPPRDRADEPPAPRPETGIQDKPLDQPPRRPAAPEHDEP